MRLGVNKAGEGNAHEFISGDFSGRADKKIIIKL